MHGNEFDAHHKRGAQRDLLWAVRSFSPFDYQICIFMLMIIVKCVDNYLHFFFFSSVEPVYE